MANYLYIDVKTGLSFDERNVRTVLDSLSNAVSENWHNPDLRDEWIDDVPYLPIKPEEWADRLPYDSPYDCWHSIELGINVFSFCFSPLSRYCADLVVSKEKDDSLSIILSVKDSIVYERRSSREMERLELELRDFQEKYAEDFRDYEMREEEHPFLREWCVRRDLVDVTLDDPVWPKNRLALLHLVEKLRETFSVTRVELDESLKGVKGERGRN